MILTNYLGVAFAATVLSAADPGVTVVYAEDGATNLVSWATLSEPTQDAVCDRFDFALIPSALASTFDLARSNLAAITAREQDGQLEPAEANRKRGDVYRAFRNKCRRSGVRKLSGKAIDRLVKRLGR